MAVFITSSLLDEYKVPHGFFTRKGGVSEGDFASLNCSHKSKDLTENVRENINRVASALRFESNSLYCLEQIHTNIVHKAEDTQVLPKGDAIFTSEKGKLLAVQTADCTPILLYASDIKAVAAVHAGWRGAVDGVIQATVNSLLNNSAAPTNILAAIGPCIQQESYEVDKLFFSQLVATNKENNKFFLYIGDKVFFNLPGYCRWQLSLCGINQIDDLARDTYSDAENFFSFRRYTHECAHAGKDRLLGGFGCQISAIAIPL